MRALLVALTLPGVAVGAEPVFEKYKVPTVGGAEINVEGDLHGHPLSADAPALVAPRA